MDNSSLFNLLLAIYLLGGVFYLITFTLDNIKASVAVIGLLLISVFYFTVQRPLSIGTDSTMYSNIFAQYASGVRYDLIPIQHQVNFFFYSLGKIVSVVSTDFSGFVFVTSALFLLSTYSAFRKIFGGQWHFAMFIFASTFIFYAFLFNLIRNSLIVGGLFWIIYLYFAAPTPRRRIVALGILLVLTYIHSSAAFVALAILVSSKLRNEKHAFVFWGISLLLSLSGIDFFAALQGFITNLVPDSALAYKAGVYTTGGGKAGFRADFVAYTLFFGVIGYVISANWKNTFYASIVKWYLIQGAIFMFFFNFEFVDRIACLAWMGLPLVIGYPAIYWERLERYRFFITAGVFFFGILNVILVAKYDFNLNLFK